MGVFSDILAEFKTNLAATSSKDNSSRGSLFRERVTEGVEDCFFWMDKTAKEAVLRAALVEKPEDFGTLHGYEVDQEGRIYVEIPVRCYNSWGLKIPRTYAVVLYDVKADGPCKVQEPGARMIRYLPGFRKVVRWTLRFGQDGSKGVPLDELVV